MRILIDAVGNHHYDGKHHGTACIWPQHRIDHASSDRGYAWLRLPFEHMHHFSKDLRTLRGHQKHHKSDAGQQGLPHLSSGHCYY